MSSNYTVVEGDHISKIAERNHFFDCTIIWDHAKNAALKTQRVNLNILYPGDTVFIPDKTPRKETRPTTRVHKFKVTPQPLQLKIEVRDFDGNPANLELKYKVESDAGKLTLPSGLFRKPILRAWENGTITVEKLAIQDVPLKIGWLDPVEYQSGQVARLNNLGYNAGVVEAPDDQQFRSAVEEFQCDNGLDVTGACDQATQDKLKEVHQC